MHFGDWFSRLEKKAKKMGFELEGDPLEYRDYFEDGDPPYVALRTEIRAHERDRLFGKRVTQRFSFLVEQIPSKFCREGRSH